MSWVLEVGEVSCECGRDQIYHYETWEAVVCSRPFINESSGKQRLQDEAKPLGLTCEIEARGVACRVSCMKVH